MRTDLRYKFTLAAISTSSVWIALFPVYLFVGAFIITFILSFVPFMKDHMWLSVTAVTVLALITGLILHLVV